LNKQTIVNEKKMTKAGVLHFCLAAVMTVLTTTNLPAAAPYYTEAPQLHTLPAPAAATSQLKKGQIIQSINAKCVLAVSGSLNYAGGKKANRQSFWFEEMKLPEAVK
jgi:hypothetical protein